MYDCASLGKAFVIRKTSYDQGHSWKNHFPEIDFNSKMWAQEYTKVLENHVEWGEKAREYYEKFWNIDAIAKYLIDKIDEHI